MILQVTPREFDEIGRLNQDCTLYHHAVEDGIYVKVPRHVPGFDEERFRNGLSMLLGSDVVRRLMYTTTEVRVLWSLKKWPVTWMALRDRNIPRIVEDDDARDWAEQIRWANADWARRDAENVDAVRGGKDGGKP